MAESLEYSTCNLTSAYHPQSSGLDEWFNQTLHAASVTAKKLRLINILMLYTFFISFFYSRFNKYSPSSFFGIWQTYFHLPIEFDMKSSLYPESYDMNSNLEIKFRYKC